MRRSITSTVGATARAVRQQYTTSSTPALFTCASCRRANHQQVPPLPSARRVYASRPFCTSRTRKQGPSAEIKAQRESVAPQTHYDFFPQTFPNGPPPASAFTPDLRQLRKEFLQLQAKTHPDLAPADQKRQAEALSSRVNEAYKALQDPLKRAQYLLSLSGIDVEDESAKLEENELLMEVMEAREAVDEVESEEELVSLREENNQRIEGSVEILEDAFRTGDLETAAKEAVRLRYWVNIEESIQGWEKGKGGGVLHH